MRLTGDSWVTAEIALPAAPVTLFVPLPIDATLIQRGNQDHPRGGQYGYHNHWVEMLTPLKFAGGGSTETVSCRLFSWGNPYDLPLDYRIPLTVNKFHDKFFGYVAV